MLTATSRKKTPCPVGSPGADGTTSVTLSGAPWRAAMGVKTFCTAEAVVSDPAVATSSSGEAPGAYAPKTSRALSCRTASPRSATVRTVRSPPDLSLIVCARTWALGPEPTTATGSWCGAGCAKAPR